MFDEARYFPRTHTYTANQPQCNYETLLHIEKARFLSGVQKVVASPGDTIMDISKFI